MKDLIGFKEKLKDSMTNSLFDYLNYMHETKINTEILEEGNNALAKCVVMCGELFANKIKKGEVSQEGIESFEANLMSSEVFAYNNEDLNLANSMVKEGNAMAFSEYESKFSEVNNIKELKKIA